VLVEPCKCDSHVKLPATPDTGGTVAAMYAGGRPRIGLRCRPGLRKG